MKPNLAIVPGVELDLAFDDAAGKPGNPPCIMQQQRPRYRNAAEERIAIQQQQSDGYHHSW